jgi:hypothetical protein
MKGGFVSDTNTEFYQLFTLRGAFLTRGIAPASPSERLFMAVGISVAMFVALFGWGATYFGWSDPEGKVQLALATSFILGIVGGYKAKN